MRSGGNNFNYFPENKLTKLANFVQFIRMLMFCLENWGGAWAPWSPWATPHAHAHTFTSQWLNVTPAALCSLAQLYTHHMQRLTTDVRKRIPKHIFLVNWTLAYWWLGCVTMQWRNFVVGARRRICRSYRSQCQGSDRAVNTLFYGRFA